jgi:hypothetical protein
LEAVLEGLGSAVGAAEAHGCLSGALCARERYAAPEWIGELVEPERFVAVDGEARRVLRSLHLETLAALRSQDFAFAPLVPDDDVTLADRVQALADWCGGFLYGLGAGGVGRELETAGDLGEVLHDLGEIARARLDPEDASEAGEDEFAELFEFVRAGVQLAFDELQVLRSAQPRGSAATH